MLAKLAFEPGWGHYEVFGIARFFRDRIYPNQIVITNPDCTTKVGGSSAGAYNDSTVGGGIGGSARAIRQQEALARPQRPMGSGNGTLWDFDDCGHHTSSQRPASSPG